MLGGIECDNENLPRIFTRLTDPRILQFVKMKTGMIPSNFENIFYYFLLINKTHDKLGFVAKLTNSKTYCFFRYNWEEHLCYERQMYWKWSDCLGKGTCLCCFGLQVGLSSSDTSQFLNMFQCSRRLSVKDSLCWYIPQKNRNI